jgi:hypothetical protein
LALVLVLLFIFKLESRICACNESNIFKYLLEILWTIIVKRYTRDKVRAAAVESTPTPAIKAFIEE